MSAEKGSWSQSGDMCKDNPAGGSLFQECQPGTCKPELLKRAITGLTDDEATMWINDMYCAHLRCNIMVSCLDPGSLEYRYV